MEYTQFNQQSYLSPQEIAAENARFITKVYGWMSLALVVTGLTAFFTASSETLLTLIFSNRLVFFGLLIGEVLLVGYISGAINRLSATTATALFLFYSLLNGLTMASIFLLYTSSSISYVFGITAVSFGVMSFYGYTTKRDLTTIGNLCVMALVGVLIASLVNFFLQSEMLYWIISYVGVFIFIGLIAYDTQKIKAMNIIGNEGTDEDHKEAILGALTLYLDFINLFIFLLRILGKRK